MYNRLPLEMLLSVIVWVVLIFTIVSSFQLILLERLIKKDDPHRSSYSKMTPENKKKIHKQFLKMFIGVTLMGLFVLIDKY